MLEGAWQGAGGPGHDPHYTLLLDIPKPPGAVLEPRACCGGIAGKCDRNQILP